MGDVSGSISCRIWNVRLEERYDLGTEEHNALGVKALDGGFYLG